MGFVEQYFIDPMLYGGGYNIVNTLVYAVILLGALYFVKSGLDKWKVELTRGLWSDLLLLVLFGGIVRALVDADIVSRNPLVVTPGIYIFVFIIAALMIYLQNRYKEKSTLYISHALLLLVAFTALFNGQNWWALVMMLALAVIVYALTELIFRFHPVLSRHMGVLSGINRHVVFAHALDSVSTFFSISFLCVGGFRYAEQHVLPSFLFSFAPIWVFIIIKVALAVAAVYYIDKEVKDHRWNWLFKFTVLVLGLGPGTRNIVSAFLNSGFC